MPFCGLAEDWIAGHYRPEQIRSPNSHPICYLNNSHSPLSFHVFHISRRLINCASQALHFALSILLTQSWICPTGLASTMTNPKKHSSKPIKYIDVCEDCYRIEKITDHIEARGSKFCPRRTSSPTQVHRCTLLTIRQTNVQQSELQESNARSKRRD